MNLISTDHPILYKKLEPFDFKNPPVDPAELATKLIEFMREKQGIGLSANQVGLPHRVFVMEGSPAYAMFNPKIVDQAPVTISLVEGCLSFPDLWLSIKRPEWVRVRFQTPNGETTTKVFGGYHARCILHELDHLDGRVYTWLASARELEKARKKQRKIQQGKIRYVENQSS